MQAKDTSKRGCVCAASDQMRRTLVSSHELLVSGYLYEPIWDLDRQPIPVFVTWSIHGEAAKRNACAVITPSLAKTSHIASSFDTRLFVVRSEPK